MQDELNNNFILAILEKYYAATEEATDVSLLQYLIERGLIPDKVISRYMILELYPHELQRCPNKEETINAISDSTGYSASHIRHTIGNPRRFNLVHQKSKK